MRVTTDNLEVAVTTAQQEIAAQLQTASAMEARLMGFLGLMAAAGTVLLTVPGALGGERWILLAGACSTIALILSGLVIARRLEFGPSAASFFLEYGGNEREPFLRQILADFGKAIADNERRIEGRDALLAGALACIAAFAVRFALVRWAGG